MLRFSISPNKDIHISHMRLAIFNYILAKQLNEELIIKIDDVNSKENIEGKDKEILEFLNLFSIEHSNVIYQSSYFKYYQKMTMQLLTQKKAFSCFCSDTKLKELKQYDDFCSTLSNETVLNTNAAFTIRIKTQEDEPFDSFVILNHDKSARPNYACALDDMIMDISKVIIEEKDSLNSLKQNYIRKSLSYEKDINYLTVCPISQTENEISIKSLIDEGFLPSTIANYLVLISIDTPKEIFTLEEAIEWFDINKLFDKTNNFDIEKLKELNKKHLNLIDDLRLSKLLGFADSDIGKLAKLFLEEVSTLKELKEKISDIFSEKVPLKGLETEFTIVKKCLQEATFFEEFEKLKQYVSHETKLDEETLLKILKYILVKENKEIDISNIYTLIRNYLGEIIK